MAHAWYALALTLLCTCVRVCSGAPACSADRTGAEVTVNGTTLAQLRTTLKRSHDRKTIDSDVSAQQKAQRTDLQPSFQGCDEEASYYVEVEEDKIDGLMTEGLTNFYHDSRCSRTKSVFTHFEQIVSMQESEPCLWAMKPEKVLSFGCSVGFECEEAKARYPGAQIYGYDIDADVITEARSRTDPALSILYTASIEDLPKYAFDLILVNNVLCTNFDEVDAFRTLRDQLWELLNPEHGVLELGVYKDDSTSGCTFNSSVAWEGLREVLPYEKNSPMPHRTCSWVNYNKTETTLFVYRHS